MLTVQQLAVDAHKNWHFLHTSAVIAMVPGVMILDAT